MYIYRERERSNNRKKQKQIERRSGSNRKGPLNHIYTIMKWFKREKIYREREREGEIRENNSVIPRREREEGGTKP